MKQEVDSSAALTKLKEKKTNTLILLMLGAKYKISLKYPLVQREINCILV
jgi:hypothetical protein